MLEFIFRWEVVLGVVGVLLTISLGVLALDDFRIAKICFVLVAADLAGGIIMWGVSTPMNTLGRIIIVAVSFALIGVLTVESFRYVDQKEAKKSKERESVPNSANTADSDHKEKLKAANVHKAPEAPKPIANSHETGVGAKIKPIIREDSFTTIIPINIAAPKMPVPLDENMKDGRQDFYNDLTSLAAVPDNATSANWPVHEPRRINTDTECFNFVTRLIQFYLLQQVQSLQRGTKGGIKVTVGEGIQPINRKPIPPPDSTEYSADKLLSILKGNEFLTPTARMIFEKIPFNVPEGTDLAFFEFGADPKEGKLFTCIVRFEARARYRLEFTIQPSFGSPTVPAGFQTQAAATIHSFSVTISMRLEVAHNPNLDAQEYITWANGLFDGLEKKMGFN